MNKLYVLLLLPLLSACSPGCGDEPSSYGASTPAAQAPAASDARLAEAEARAADAERQLAESQAATPGQPAPSASQPTPAAASGGGSYRVGAAPGAYAGSVDATGLRQLCETYERTTVARFRGLRVCYNVVMQQHRDGSLQGTGYKSWEALAGTSGRDLGPSEQSPIRVSGYIDNSDTIRLEYTVQGAQRGTKGVATIDATRMAFTDGGGNPTWAGTFRTDAANASGSVSYTGYALRD